MPATSAGMTAVGVEAPRPHCVMAVGVEAPHPDCVVGAGNAPHSHSVMAGLVPAIHVFHHVGMRGGYVYILTNRPNGILYVGVTNDLVRRVFEHRSGAVDGFTKRYGLKRLVYFEHSDDIRVAIQREHTVKHWPRAWKIRMILRDNPDWDDLYDAIV